MPLILVNRDEAESYTVAQGDTLTSIALAKCQALGDWKVLARYNWGTAEPAEVLRALVETVGVKVSDLALPATKAHPELVALEPDPKLPHTVKIPKAWKSDDLAREKRHTLKVRPVRAATVVHIEKLDRWFIPDTESCDMVFDLEGDPACADKVRMEVYGSNYCECDAWSDGLGTWDKPDAHLDDFVYEANLTPNITPRQRNDLMAAPWKGEANAKKGVLSRQLATEASRRVNVAFSPYTVHLRYWKDSEVADQDARIVLQPFWPRWKPKAAAASVTLDVQALSIKASWTNAAVVDRAAVEVCDKDGRRVFFKRLSGADLQAGAKSFTWDRKYYAGLTSSTFEEKSNDDDKPYKINVTTETSKLDTDSLVIKWEVRRTTKLERGVLRVVDRNDKTVFLKPLQKADLAEKKHELKWDGKLAPGVQNSAGGDVVIAADMPYRVQIEGHTGNLTDKGLALAAMHTEVRLYVAPETANPDHFAYDGEVSVASAVLGQGPLVPGDDPPGPGGGEDTKWLQWQLAQSGFHPGLVSGNAHAAFHRALEEFKRTVPKHKTGLKYERLDINTSVDAATLAAMQNLPARCKRGVYGDQAKVLGNDDAPDLSEAEARDALADATRNVVVWADARIYYTTSLGTAALDDANAQYTSGSAAATAFGLAGHRGGMDIGDGAVAKDASAVPSPWLPLQVELVLLSKNQHLDAAPNPLPDANARAAMRAAIGPLRVDWSFDELAPDLSVIDHTHANYDKSYIRSRRYVAWAIGKDAATHTRKDTGRKARYTNCLKDRGGARPSSLSGYYKELFGLDAEGLAPWRPKAVGDTETVATVVHDQLAAAQVAGTDLFEKQRGKSGVCFLPSRIAGDGYRVRADVRFEKFAGYAFPNLATLDARYPTRPQAHSPALRVWRKTSLRGYINWGGASGHGVGDFMASLRAHYRPAHVYFVHEAGVATPIAITDIFDATDNGDQTRFNDIVHHNAVAQGASFPAFHDRAHMRLSNDGVWPWSHRDDFGLDFRSALNLADDKVGEWVSGNANGVWGWIRSGLLLDVLREVEREHGLLSGHLMVEFTASAPLDVLCYRCNGTTAHEYWYVQRHGLGAARKNGTQCGAPGCKTATNVNSVLAYNRHVSWTALPLSACGLELGATWLFWRGEAEDRLKVVWPHEVGHHRHLEHASNGPGAKKMLHDSGTNKKVAWTNQQGIDDPLTRGWDRRCVMSYADCKYGEYGYFCGKCLLRGRGWKVEPLGAPPGAKGEP